MLDLSNLEMLVHDNVKVMFKDIFISTITVLLVISLFFYFMTLALSFIKKI